jgi:hypothetical protein
LLIEELEDEKSYIQNYKQMGGLDNVNFYQNVTKKTVRILVDQGIQFDIDLVSDSLTSGWLINEVTRLYTELLVHNNMLAKQQNEKDFR